MFKYNKLGKSIYQKTSNCSACGYAWPYLELQVFWGGAVLLIVAAVLVALVEKL